MPVALLYVGKLIIDQVVALNTNSPAGNLQELWQLVALEFALALLTDGLNRMINLQIVYWAICFLIILLYEL
jgi:ATP-binding cassette subfamily B protein